MSEQEKKAIEIVEDIAFIRGIRQDVDGELEDLKAIEDVLRLVDKQQKEIEELKKENAEIRSWKYTIDTIEDLDKLKELDLIKIKGKEYISKDKIREKINELEKYQEENSKELYNAIDLLNFTKIGIFSNRISINLEVRTILKELLGEQK